MPRRKLRPLPNTRRKRTQLPNAVEVVVEQVRRFPEPARDKVGDAIVGLIIELEASAFPLGDHGTFRPFGTSPGSTTNRIKLMEAVATEPLNGARRIAFEISTFFAHVEVLARTKYSGEDETDPEQ